MEVAVLFPSCLTLAYVTVLPVESGCLEGEAESLGGIRQQHCCLEEACAQVESMNVSVYLDLPRNSA